MSRVQECACAFPCASSGSLQRAMTVLTRAGLRELKNVSFAQTFPMLSQHKDRCYLNVLFAFPVAALCTSRQVAVARGWLGLRSSSGLRTLISMWIA